MAIRVSHAPIGAAMQLAQQAGRGEDFWRRRQSEVEGQRNVLAQREQQARERASTIQQGLEERQLGIRERESQARLSQSDAQFRARERSEERQQRSEERRMKQFETTQESNKARRAMDERKEKRMTEQSDRNARIAEKRLEVDIDRQERLKDAYKRTWAYREQNFKLKQATTAVKTFAKEMEQWKDPFAKGGYRYSGKDAERFGVVEAGLLNARNRVEELTAAQKAGETLFSEGDAEGAMQTATSPGQTSPMTGGVAPKEVQVQVGDKKVTVPAPHKDLMPPQQGALLDEYPAVSDALYSHFLRSISSTAAASQTLEQQDQALGTWLGVLGWSP
jgi:hypothetical protein